MIGGQGVRRTTNYEDTYKLSLDLSVLFLKLGYSLLERGLIGLLWPGGGGGGSSIISHGGRAS